MSSRLLGRCCSTFIVLSSRRSSTHLFPPQTRACRLFATFDKSNDNKKKKSTKVPKSFKINENASDKNSDLLAAAFADMARKEGFDDSTAFYADSATFDDDFEDDDYIKDDEDDDAPLDADDVLNDDFDDDSGGADDFLDLGSDEDDMDTRIAAARRDMDMGRVSVSKDLEKLADDPVNLKMLGFKRELNPFGNDETPRRDQFRLIENAMTCSACGSDFQCQHETKAGYLPPEKFDIQLKLRKVEDIQKLQEKADSATEWSPEDEIDYLLQTFDSEVKGKEEHLADLDVNTIAEDMGLDLVALSQKKIICKRCHGLQNFGRVDDALRPGWTEDPALSQETFRQLLQPLREKPAIIIALVDLFDFAGSVLTELDAIRGDNPVLIAANKVDLLPTKMGQQRAENWVRRELEYMGVQSAGSGSVRLVSCKTGFGVAGLLGKARQLMEEENVDDVYVVGAANAGKSTLLNHLLEKNSATPWRQSTKKRAGNANAQKNALTVSPLPGTTLKFIKMDLGDGKSLYDTPGLLVPGTFTQLMTPDELKMLVPKKEVEPITFRVPSGKCVLIGGLAKVEIVGEETKPFLLTFFVANDIKLHPTDSSKADEFIEKHIGTPLLSPPLELKDWEWEYHDVEIQGAGWKEAAADISITGLGWVAVTGAGVAQVKITVPRGIGVAVRPPLMPFDVWEVASRYTGGRAVRKVTKSKAGGKRKGVGRR